MSGVSRKQAPDLDASIWANVFQSFNVSQWACASGICKITWYLQFDQLIFDNPLTREGSTFVLQHCRVANSLQDLPKGRTGTAGMYAFTDALSAHFQQQQEKGPGPEFWIIWEMVIKATAMAQGGAFTTTLDKKALQVL